MHRSRPIHAHGFALSLLLAPAGFAQFENCAPREVFVVNTQDASISRIHVAEMKEISRHTVGPRPYGIAMTNDGATLAVGVEDEEKVKFFDVQSFKLVGETPIGRMFNDHIVSTTDGQHVLVANFYSDDVVGIDVKERKEAFRISGTSAPHVVKLGPLRRRAFVTCKKVPGIAILDPTEHSVLKTFSLNVNPRSLTFAPDESKLYFASFWVDGVFELDAESGKVTRMLALEPPASDEHPREITYHGVEMVAPAILLAANEGRSYVDAIDLNTGKLLDRAVDGVASPCCVELIPGTAPPQVLVSNLGDGTLAKFEISSAGKLNLLGKVTVGKSPKRVAFTPAHR